MFEAVMIAATGIQNQQRRVDTIADNVANVNTVGFKNDRLDFKDALYTAGIVPGPARTPEGNQQKGHGVMTASITRDFRSGSLLSTENELDFTIVGEGFFELRDPYGNILYSRGGNFYSQPASDGQNYLVNSSGYFVCDENDQIITVPQGTIRTEVAEDGLVTFVSEDGGTQTRRLGLYTFENLMGLEAAGRGNYSESATSGQRTAANVQVMQGMLEMSNVNLGTEMTRLIRAQRAFSLSSRALTTADDMEGIANNLRR